MPSLSRPSSDAMHRMSNATRAPAEKVSRADYIARGGGNTKNTREQYFSLFIFVFRIKRLDRRCDYISPNSQTERHQFASKTRRLQHTNDKQYIYIYISYNYIIIVTTVQ
uniref:Uncharacterized protein n=1 Tax=Sipha flava TaxID=143950 RepID=A0A2S2R7J4_9HEMI